MKTTHLEPIEIISKASNNFAINAYNLISQDKGNVFFSPLSIHAALAICMAGATGTTLNEMLSTLHLEQSEDIHNAYGKLLKELQTSKTVGKYDSGDPYKFTIANRLWNNIDFQPLENYLKLLGDAYEAAMETLDFSKNESAAKTINDWVDNKTNGKIKNLISPDLLSKDISLILTNAVWFKASWNEAFKKYATQNAAFYGMDKTYQVKMMNMTDDMRYFEDEKIQAVTLPYKGGAEMLVILPKEEKNVNITYDYTTEIKQKATNEKVRLSFPKFHVEAKYKLGNLLKNMGMPSAFSEQDAEFELISSKSSYISEVIHKAFIDVDEDGTEAAAATAVIMNKCRALFSPSQPKIVNVNRPFVYTIEAKDTILFMGKVESF